MRRWGAALLPLWCLWWEAYVVPWCEFWTIFDCAWWDRRRKDDLTETSSMASTAASTCVVHPLIYVPLVVLVWYIPFVGDRKICVILYMMIAIFVIAHPDDESMFFLPTICGLDGRTKWLVCLSNGNYDGLGKTREVELHRVGAYLGMDRVVVVDHKELQDSPHTRWAQHVVSSVLDEKLPKEQRIELYTFDVRGVSGHINHVDTHLGVRHYLGRRQRCSTKGAEKIKAFQLMTVLNPLQKYIPLWHWIILLLRVLGVLRYKTFENGSSTRFTMYQPWVNWKCMASHTSQFVWYRRLFVAFSCYTYENQWQPIEPTSQWRSSHETAWGSMQFLSRGHGASYAKVISTLLSITHYDFIQFSTKVNYDSISLLVQGRNESVDGSHRCRFNWQFLVTKLRCDKIGMTFCTPFGQRHSMILPA